MTIKNKIKIFVASSSTVTISAVALSLTLASCGCQNTPIVEPTVIIDNWTKDSEVSYLDLTSPVTNVNKTDIYGFVVNASKFEWTARYSTTEFAIKPVSTNYLQFNVLSITSSKTGRLRPVELGVVQDNSFYIEQSAPHFIVHINHDILSDDLITITLKFNDDYAGNDTYAYFRNQQ